MERTDAAPLRRFLVRTLVDGPDVRNLVLVTPLPDGGFTLSLFEAETSSTLFVDDPVAVVRRESAAEAVEAFGACRSVAEMLPLAATRRFSAVNQTDRVLILLKPGCCRIFR